LSIDEDLSIFHMINGDVAHIRKGDLPKMKRRYADRLIERVRLA